jgi:hypothetical protein
MRYTFVADGDAVVRWPESLSRARATGTAVAKDSGMLTIFAFVVAMGSVFMSVLWACKEDTANRA